MPFRPAFASLLLLLLAVLPARGDVPMSGTYIANTACPALSSIKKASNTGNVALTPGRSYELLSANKQPPSYYLLLVPDANPDRRWVAIACGTVAGSNPATATPAATATAPGPTAATQSVPGGPTHFVLSISWEPGFCAGASGKPECRAETPGGFDATHFTLHGLWPDPKEYCGAASTDIAADKAGKWDSLPAVSLSAGVKTRLAAAMPGTQSLLERHEWLRHGTCAGVDANAYFGRALDFLDAINASPAQALVAGAAGQQLTLDAIRTAFDQGFGNGAGDRIRLSCSRDGGDRRITEITIGLDGGVMGAASLNTLIAGAAPTNGGCDSGLVTAVR